MPTVTEHIIVAYMYLAVPAIAMIIVNTENEKRRRRMSVFESGRKMTNREQEAFELGYKKAKSEIVYCKDCIYSGNWPYGLCFLHTEPCINDERGYKGEAVCVELDDYCSSGKKKEDEGKGEPPCIKRVCTIFKCQIQLDGYCSLAERKDDEQNA